jgi:hypothetical protein
LGQQWAKEKRSNKWLKWAWAFEHLPQARNWANNGPKKRRANCGPKRDFPSFFFGNIIFIVQHKTKQIKEKWTKKKVDR